LFLFYIPTVCYSVTVSRVNRKFVYSVISSKDRKMTDILEEITKFLFRFIFEILFIWTGEIILFLITFGKHKPRWDLYTKESPGRFIIFSEISLWIGMVFWIVIIAVSYKLLAMV
jgi:hypothetical protein